MALIRIFVSLLLCVNTAIATLEIVSGASWTAAGINQHVQAHGGQITRVGNLFYFIGENKLDGSLFQSVSCYSSPDLVQWTFVNQILKRQGSGDLGPNRIIERPKVLYNGKTNKWVMWMHVDNTTYGEGKTGVATSTGGICGDYTYLGSQHPLGVASGDMNLFEDTPGVGYLLGRDRHAGLHLYRLTDDYTNVVSITYTWRVVLEAPAMVKHNGVYFVVGSHLTGWRTNDNQYSSATSILGPWSAWTTFAPVGSNTYSSQSTCMINVGSTVMFMGDRWNKDNLMASTYMWQPLIISGQTMKLGPFQPNWSINPSTGAWAAGPKETAPEAEDTKNTLGGGAARQSCSGCSGGKEVTGIGGSNNGFLQFNGVSSSVSAKTTIRIRYENGVNGTQRYAQVSVNGGTPQTVSFIPTMLPVGQPVDGVVHVNLNAGSANTLKFSGYNGTPGPEIDRLFVPQS